MIESSSRYLAVVLLVLGLEAALLPEAERLGAFCGAFSPFLPPDLTMLTPAAIRVTAATAAPAITPTDMPDFCLAGAAAARLTGAGAE